ncbi:hypothetical protein ACOTVV_11200 [Aliarcobacter butzleri]
MKYIFAIVTILLFSGCQQAINDFNQSLAQNLNSRTSEEVQIPNYDNLDTELKKFKQERVDFYKKFLVTEDESLETINSKYQDSTNLMVNAKKEYNNLRAKASKLLKTYPNYDFDFTIYGNTNFLQFGMFSTRYNSYIPDELKNYINTDEYITIYNKELGDYLTTKHYQSYLKKSYDSYPDRVMLQKSQERDRVMTEQRNKEFAQQKIKQDKVNKIKAEQAQSERAKVKVACDNWLKQAKKDVYSLGVGDNIVEIIDGKTGIGYQIIAIEKNTFLVELFGMRSYVQKSNHIPYNSIKNAPSVYCYK